jgi:hypothetical protein
VGAAPAANWASTDTTAFNLNLIPNAADLGPASSSTPLQLLVSLQLQNTSVMYAYFQHITTPGDALYGHYLNPSEFAAMYSPSMAQAEQVIGYLHAIGFTDISLSDNRTLIRMTGTVGLAQTAFSTQLHQMQYNGQTVLVNTLPALVPAALGNLVLSITGLDTVPKMHFNHPIKAGTTPSSIGIPDAGSLSGYSPQNFQSIYDADLTLDPSATKVPNPVPKGYQFSDTELNDGRNATIAIIAEGDLTSVLSDLKIFEFNQELPTVTPIVIKTAPPALITDTSGADEFDLDTQSSTGLANNVKNLYIYDIASLFDTEIINGLNQFVSDDLAPAASFSVGGCETFEIPELSAYNQVFTQMAIQGQTLFASTGDSGASCFNPAGNGVPVGVPGVEFPAASPYVVGVGGTTLLEQASTTQPAPYNEVYDVEVAWYSGGGGTSIFQIAPSWQIPVLPTGAVTSTNTPRGVPDIAMDADANTPANVVVSGVSEGVGGTSLASPLALGAWARMQSIHGNNLGYAPPDLYALDSGPLTAASGFHDIIVGDNVGYAATPGWDYTTGLGSFDIAEITPLLKPIAAAITPNPVVNTGNICTAPGFLLAQNTVAGIDTPTTGHDPEKLYVAELYAPNTPESDALTFTLDVDSIAQSTLYLVYFSTNDGVQHYLAYESTTDGTTPFTYGHITYSTDPTMTGLLSMQVFNNDGVLDSASMADTTNNDIVFVLPKSDITMIDGTVSPDNTLSRLYGEAGTEVGFLDTGTVGYDELGVTSTYDTPQSSYTPIGNASCSSTASGTSTGGTSGGTTGGTSTGGTSGGSSTGGTSGGSSSGGTSGGSSTGGTSGGSSTGGTSGGSSTGGTSGGSSTGGTSGGTTGGSTSGGSSTGGTSGGTSTGGTSGGSSTGGTSGGTSTGGGSSTGGTSGGATAGGTSGGTTTGGGVGTTTGGMSTGGSSAGGTSTGGTSTGGESSTGGSSGGSTGGTGSDGGSSTGGTGANGDTTGGTTGTSTTVGTSGNGSTGYHGFFGGSFGEALVPLALLAGVRRRRKTQERKRA